MTVESEAPRFVPLPPPQLSVPEPDHMFALRHTDWQRVRTQVGRLSDPRPVLNNVAWTFFGIAASAGLALPPWLAAYGDLQPASQRNYFWVTVVLAATALCSLIIAVVCWVTSGLLRRATEVTIETVCEDMDNLYRPHQRR